MTRASSRSTTPSTITADAPKRPVASATLTREQEFELFQSINDAEIHISELERSGDVNSVELRHWRKVANDGMGTVVMAHQGWVAHLVRDYQGRGLDPEDLMQEGNRGLMNAMGKFDCRLGNRFTTYATFWIRQAICRALSKHSRTVRIPENQLEAIRKMKAAKAQLLQETGCEPTAEEIARAMDITVTRVRELLELDQSAVSLDSPAGDADGATILDFMGDSAAADPAEAWDAGNSRKLLGEAMKSLSERERQVLELRSGLDGERRHTLEEIGQRFGVSRERIRQIENVAKENLRRFASAKELENLVNTVKTSVALDQIKNPPPLNVALPTAKSGTTRLKMRSVAKNPNHHIWNNNGAWYCNFKIKTANGEAKRVRNPLHTRNVEEARRRRDAMIRLYQNSASRIAA